MESCFPCLGGAKKKRPPEKPQIPSSSEKPNLGPSPSVMKQDSLEVNKDAANKDIVLSNGSDHHQIAAQTFTFRDLAVATRNFRPDCLLGGGGFGRVYKGYLNCVNQVVAIKQLDRNGLQGNREFLVEVLMLSLLHHPNLVSLIGYCADGDQRLLVYEYMPLGSLEDHLHDPSPDKAQLDWNTRMKIAAGAAKGLEYLHDKASPPVIYRDLKCSNILLGEGYHPKLSDFGLAKLGPVGDKTHVSTRVMGTYGYCAPEYAMTGQLTLKSDIYSFGVVLLEIITGRRAIDNTRVAGEQNLVAWIQIHKDTHNCASRSRVLGKMASIAWVAERAIPLQKRKPNMGAAAVKEELEEKYKIQIAYQTIWYGRQRVADKLFEAGSSRKQGAARILSDSLFGGEGLCSSISVGSTPMKMLIDDEVSGDVRHASPSIVGRLMGLDTMPSFGYHSNSTCGICSHFMSPGSYCDKYGFSGDVPNRISTDHILEFKDVFEVMESARMKTQSLSSGCLNTCSGPDKVNSAEMNFLRQKFMDAKCLSTKESFKRLKEFDGALEALVLNKDLLLEFLQKSNNILMKDSTDISRSPFSAVNRITVLKPSRRNKFVDADIIYPPEDTTMCCCAPKGAKHSPTNPCANHCSQPLEEETSSFRQKFSRSSFKERIDTHCSPTRIVVLKPCLGKTENMEGAFPLTHEMCQSSYRKSKAPLDYGSAAQSRHTEEYMYQMPTGKFDVFGPGGKGSIEIAREVTKEITRAVKRGISGNRIFTPDIGPFSCDAQASLLSYMAKLKSSEAYQRSNRKTSIRKEAKRRLYDRWKITHQYQHPSQDANSFRTLGDMLALSDKEVSKFTSGSSICCECPKGELHKDGMPGLCGYPLGISSNDGWKDENVCNSTRLKSLPSSITQQCLKMTSRRENYRLGEFSVLKDIVIVAHNNSEDGLVRGRPMRSLVRTSTRHCNESDLPSLDGDESMVTEREIHVNFEEPACSVAVIDSSEERLVQPANSKHILSAQCCLDSSYMVPEWQDEDQASVSGNLVMHQESTWVLDDHIVSHSPSDSANEAEEHVLDQCAGYAFTSNPTEESVSHVSSCKDDQPPVSVSESSLGAEDGCSGGFEKISADLQELRMQLQLLRIEATNNDDETALWSDNGISASCKPHNEAGQMSNTFWDADERDFAYVLDILTCMGIQSNEQEFLLDACYLWEYPAPASSDVYESLEKKYGKYIRWPQSDRRLLFDLTNDALMGVVTCLEHSGMRKKRQSKRRGKDSVLDHVWGRVCRQRQEAECFKEERLMGVEWLDCEDATYQIAGELESMLGAGLLEEVAELLL